MGAIRAILGSGPRIHYDDLLRVPLSSVDQDAAGLGESVAKLARNIVRKQDGAAL